MRPFVITLTLILLIGSYVWAETASDIQSKLKALENAYTSGILSDEEYASKKAELEKQLQNLDDSKQQKLKALEDAHQAGILSDEEYARKKAELLGTSAKGKIYRHATGFSFLHPEDWTVTEQEGYLQLNPPNPSSADGAPTELYFVLVEDASGDNIQRPDDPMVLEYLEGQIHSLSPAFTRTGTPSPVDMRVGKGVVVDWGATGTGGEALARAFVGIANNYGLVLIGMGLRQQIEARDQVLRQIFSSFGFGEPQRVSDVSIASGQETTGVAASSAISGGEVGDPNWGFKFRPPEGWKSQKTDEFILLGHDTIAGAIFVLPHMEESFEAVQMQMQRGLSEESVQLSPISGLQAFGNNAIGGEYSGVADGQQVKARGIGTFSPYGGGAYIVAMTVPDKYGPQLAGAADAIARGMQYFKVEVSELMQHFAGTWVHTTKSTLTNITLGADGSYSDTYEAGYYGDFKNGLGDSTGSWGAASNKQSAGRWTVRGNKQQGVIVIKLSDGTEKTLEYRVFVEKGQTYWNEYLFNGEHYGKTR